MQTQRYGTVDCTVKGVRANIIVVKGIEVLDVTRLLDIERNVQDFECIEASSEQ